MTDSEAFDQVLGSIDHSVLGLRVVRRNGRALLGLPVDSAAAAKSLGLYQPQRPAARALVRVLRGLTSFGLHGYVLPGIRVDAAPIRVSPALSGIEAGTCGILLGSPEHRVRRAISSYRNSGNWEVAKVSFGAEGARVLEDEAGILQQLAPIAAGVPRLLGLHRGADVTLLRMPYLTGQNVGPGESAGALKLLESWMAGETAKPAGEFPEWPAILSALSGDEAGQRALERLSREVLRPVVRHGDFARWNLLKQKGGSLIALDWEWGHEAGMPGLDLAHYFLQDSRLVEDLDPAAAILKARRRMKADDCRSYLERAGWSGDPILPVIASLAYKQGAGHQDNAEVLRAAVALL